MNACLNNLRQIAAGKRSYSLEYGKTQDWAWVNDEDAFKELVGSYIKEFVLCPSSTTTVPSDAQSAADYKVNPIGVNPECQIHPETHKMKDVPYNQQMRRFQSEPDIIIAKAIEPYLAMPYSELVKMIGAEPNTLDLNWSCSKAYQVAIWAMWENESNGNICVMGMVKAKKGEKALIPHKRSFIKSPSNQFLGEQEKE